MLKAYIALTVLSRINYALSDAVVVWRAFILFQRRSIVRFVLVFCLLVSSVAAIIDCSYFIISGIRNINPSPSRYLVLLLPMLLTNVIATMCITWRTWYYQQFETATMQDSASDSGKQIKKVLYLLVESGFVYCIIWLLAIISTQPGGTLGTQTGQSVFGGLLPHISAIYPTLIIILMSCQNISSSPGDTLLSRSLELSEHPNRYGFGGTDTITIGTVVDNVVTRLVPGRGRGRGRAKRHGTGATEGGDNLNPNFWMFGPERGSVLEVKVVKKEQVV
ncbi:hypothetical protein D9758_009610 [Tetrapyrgos nigripes]|uniref:Uncharacterized protein n=1 Tax=Tetrapyrgos nigripes TaxID=182062 RepID=A0A8H5GDC4_9AGAR|nr:hypothetical protein D9758_009610 [Tetrapyrgos nigripes]